MKKVLCACLAMLVLLCGAAMAEHFRCQLPEGAWLGDTTPLREGDALLLAGGKALYREYDIQRLLETNYRKADV